MPIFNEIIFVSFTAEQMFTLVNDIEKYPIFLPGIKSLTIIKDDINDNKNIKLAEMIVGKGPIKEKFVTSVSCQTNHIKVDYISGPFTKLFNEWIFIPHSKDGIDGCLIEFKLEYILKNKLYGRMFSPILKRIFFTLANAFIQRAREIYGSNQFKSITLKSDHSL